MRNLSLVQQRTKQVASGGNWSSWAHALGAMSWSDYLETLVREINAHDRKTLILIDELSLFVAARLRTAPDTVLGLLHNLRRLRQQYPNVRWMFTGSIGLDALARHHDLGGALLGYENFAVRPFSREAARAFLDDLNAQGRVFRKFELTDESFAHLAAELGWLSPYYLEHIAKQIRATGRVGSTGASVATSADVDLAFDALLSPDFRNYFIALDEHITKNFNREDTERLSTLLEVCSRSPVGELLQTLDGVLRQKYLGLTAKELRALLDILVADGFLLAEEEGSRYRFRSGLVRRYWRRYHAP